ncbi:hypothetical protein [Methanogenium cariaci]|uniref:hypothetical protein n=1 Tax=Methanogenium cariaci TaxID=2197 RepID=UPI002480BC4E|nr:hypothetical protein [Methanogenium cariaci]
MEGLHPFSTENLRRLFDFTCYVDPAEEVKYAWKMARDVGGDRGYSHDQVNAEIRARKPDYEAYVAPPQRQYADAIIRITPPRSLMYPGRGACMRSASCRNGLKIPSKTLSSPPWISLP